MRSAFEGRLRPAVTFGDTAPNSPASSAAPPRLLGDARVEDPVRSPTDVVAAVRTGRWPDKRAAGVHRHQAALKAQQLTPEQICKRDEERLASLRASRERAAVIRFERELSCERLRPQVVRL